VHISRRSEGVIEGSHFEENDVSGDGGGVYTIETSRLSITHSVFHSESPTMIKNPNSKTYCDCVENNATHGGAFMVNRFSEGEVMWSNFTNNTSSKQAGVAKVNRNSTLSFTTSLFFCKTSKILYYCYTYDEFLLRLSGCGFVDCSSSYGGVMIAEHESNLTVDSSLFENNTASGNGGAINLWLGSNALVTNVTLFGTPATSLRSHFVLFL